jgi:hypothetical protein
MGELNRTVVRKFRTDDPDFEEKNMMIFEGTPSERWAAIRDVNRLARGLQNKAVVPDSRLRRDVVRLYTWSDGKEPPETN